MTKEEILKRLNRHSIITNECWLWKGCKTIPYGYGKIRLDKKYLYVHRISAFLFLGLDLDDTSRHAAHKDVCSNTNCWNPEHLYIATPKENTRDLIKAGKHISIFNKLEARKKANGMA